MRNDMSDWVPLHNSIGVTHSSGALRGAMNPMTP